MGRNARKIIYYLLLSVFITNCNVKKETHAQQAISVRELFEGDFCMYLKDFQAISPNIIPWATDFKNPYSESFIISKDKIITFKQDEKDPKAKTIGLRHCFLNEKKLETKQVVIDSLSFLKLEGIAIDYGQEATDVYQNKNLILFINQPMGWSGKSNQYRLVQIVDLQKQIYYEFFVNYCPCNEE